MSINGLTPERAALKAQIESAFGNVTREDGISLHEAMVIDDYGSDRERAEARRRDTDIRWQDVLATDLESAPSCFAFLDAKGLRYYLPAYMIWFMDQPEAWQSNAAFLFIYTLCIRSPRDQERFRLLTEAQSAAICQFLRFMDRLAEEDEEFYDPSVREALDSYWHQFPLDKAMLQFSEQWFKLGILTEEDLQAYGRAFETSDDKNTEHYRYRAFREFLSQNRPLSPEQCDALYELGAADPDFAMGSSMMDTMVRLLEYPPEVIEKARASGRKHLVRLVERKAPQTRLPDT